MTGTIAGVSEALFGVFTALDDPGPADYETPVLTMEGSKHAKGRDPLLPCVTDQKVHCRPCGGPVEKSKRGRGGIGQRRAARTQCSGRWREGSRNEQAVVSPAEQFSEKNARVS